MTLPTIEELHSAQDALKAAMARQDGYDGNNPNKHATSVRLAREEVARLTRALKAAGLLPRTDHETLEAKLDFAFPEAANKDEVSFEGARYARWFSPATRSLSGNAMSWDRGWTSLDPVMPLAHPED